MKETLYLAFLTALQRDLLGHLPHTVLENYLLHTMYSICIVPTLCTNTVAKYALVAIYVNSMLVVNLSLFCQSLYNL